MAVTLESFGFLVEVLAIVVIGFFIFRWIIKSVKRNKQSIKSI